ncbi:hypothetical protein [Streptacidiphilus anmyonensis]|uniref:hypothetical protein n=1 Tax=Streptacidiphilus anmyonensis TaxID=405782 RepID=UPI0005A74797|nr:hypothetical protein [Streptacidiphilus anmyonensis]
MASVLGLLEERELAARERVEVLEAEVDRLLAELAQAEADRQGWVIARQRVGEVLSASPGGDAIAEDGPASSAAEPVQTAFVATVVVPPTTKAARAGSIVPVRRPGMEPEVLATDYQRILTVLAEQPQADGDLAMTCQQFAMALGLELTPAQVEGVRSKAKRLVNRGSAPGRFVLA